MVKRISYYICLLCMSISTLLTAIDKRPALPLLQGIETITALDFYRHIAYLGSDSLKGRATGSQGERLAADYIMDHLHKENCLAGTASGYLQTIPMHGSYPLKSSELVINIDDKSVRLDLGQDYVLYKSGAQTFIPNPVPMVFVGYGIIAPEYDYNDYQSMDVTGKVVVYLSGEPPSDDPEYFLGKEPTIYSYPESKQRLAIARGARGSIMIPNSYNERRKTWDFWQNAFSFEDVTLAYSVTSHFSIMLHPNIAETLFTKPLDLQTVLKMDQDNTMSSFPLKSTLSFKGQFRQRDFFANNIIGIVPGSDPELKSTYIICSAHYDHLGIGKAVRGDSVYNGVFDNAAGVAALLQITKALNQIDVTPRRSIVFLFLTGEEKGVLGSTYYTDHPVYPLHKTVANVNVDGVAMFDTFNDIVGIGSEYSTIENELSLIASVLGLGVSSLPSEFLRTESFARSDQIVFAKAGIPSVMIMEGLDYRNLSKNQGLNRLINWQTNIYHTPFDDLLQPMNLEASRQHVRFLFAFIWHLANTTKPPEWKPGVPYINARLQSIAEKK
ncbi:M28 family peptidase [candidate division KSB1 bacterium]|nr:M28 family peptidase [candidate division KSB1 bacterium]